MHFRYFRCKFHILNVTLPFKPAAKMIIGAEWILVTLLVFIKNSSDRPKGDKSNLETIP